MLELTTDRLLLRPLAPGDLDAFVEYRRDPEIARFQGWEPTYSKSDAEELLAAQPSEPGRPGEWLQIAVVERGTNTLLGDCALRISPDQPGTAELGITLTRAHQGSGVAREALGALITWLFADRALHRVFAQTDERNAAAHRLFDGLGFRLEGRLVDADWYKGEWTTIRVYALLAREWRAAGT